MELSRRLILGLYTLSMLLPPLPVYAQGAPVNLRDRAIEYVTESDMSAGPYNENASMTRIEFLSMLVHDVYYLDDEERCFSEISSRPGRAVRYTHLFTDVPRSESFAGELCIGMHAGLVQGRSNGTFAPHAPITYAEAAKWVTKAYGIAPRPSLRPNPTVPWYEPYRFAVASRGGMPRTVKNVHQQLTKGEAAELLYLLRTDKPAYGQRSNELEKEVQQETLNIDLDKSPVQSLKVRFVSPSDKGVITIRATTKNDAIRSFHRVTARTRRDLLRNGETPDYQRALTEEQKSELTRAVSRMREQSPVGRDWKFISPEDRPSARSIHDRAQKNFRGRAR